MRNYFKKLILIFVFQCFSAAHAGSYEEFFIAVKQDNPAVVQALLQRGFDANTLDPEGTHALFVAVREPSLKVADVLADWPRTQVEWRNRHDESPLMLAALKGHTALVKKLIARGGDVNKTGWTPLHYAATNGHVEIIGLLIDAHAYVDAESPNKTTPLMMAAHYGSPAAVKALLEAGADPNLKNDLGLTAIDFAFRANRKDAADMIAAAIRAKRPKGQW